MNDIAQVDSIKRLSLLKKYHREYGILMATSRENLFYN